MRGERRRSFWRAAIVTCGIGLFLLLLIFGLALMLGQWEQFGGPKVALLEVNGLITDSEGVIRQIQHHIENETVQAFVIRINSPAAGWLPLRKFMRRSKRFARSMKSRS